MMMTRAMAGLLIFYFYFIIKTRHSTYLSISSGFYSFPPSIPFSQKILVYCHKECINYRTLCIEFSVSILHIHIFSFFSVYTYFIFHMERMSYNVFRLSRELLRLTSFFVLHSPSLNFFPFEMLKGAQRSRLSLMKFKHTQKISKARKKIMVLFALCHHHQPLCTYCIE